MELSNQNMKDMISSILNKDREGFDSAFKNEMQDRVGSHLVDKNLELSKDILSTENGNPTIEESRGTTFKFKSPSDAKKFATSAAKTPGLVGVSKRNFSVKGKDVLINGIKDKEMLQMLTMLAKEMK